MISSAELLSYQIGWGEFLVSWYQQGLTGVAFVMPGGSFETWDYKKIAKHFFNKRSGLTLEQLLEIFHNLVITIVEIIEKEHSLGNLKSLGVWKWCTLKSGKMWPLSKWIRVNTVAPYKRAAALLKVAFLNRK